MSSPDPSFLAAIFIEQNIEFTSNERKGWFQLQCNCLRISLYIKIITYTRSNSKKLQRECSWVERISYWNAQWKQFRCNIANVGTW